MGCVRNIGLFKAAYEATGRLLRSHPQLVPTQLLWGTNRYLRFVSMEHCPGLDGSADSRLSQAVADGVRTVRGEKEDKARWSGSGMGVAPSQGGLYVSLDSAALSAELAHYHKWLPRTGSLNAPDVLQAFVPGALKWQALFRLRPIGSLMAVDFSKHSPGRMAFFEALGRDDGLRAALGSTHGAADCERASRDGSDYSVSRAVALALAASTAPSYDGILARTARDNQAIRDDGDNLVLFGDNQRPHPKLTVECVVAPVTQPNGQMTLRLIGY